MAEAKKVLLESAAKSKSNTSDTEESVADDSEWETASEDDEAADAVYQFKVTLKQTKPAIWRRILVLNTSTFADLHTAVNCSMGWLDTHLHGFRKGDLEISSELEKTNSAVMDFMLQLTGQAKPRKLDETKVKLWEMFKKPKDSIDYLYDFDDDWWHKIVLEKILPLDNRSYPICVAGGRSCPPDDCGGVPGYEKLLKALSDPNDPEHQDMKEWMNFKGDAKFDPDSFNPNSVIFV